MNNRKKPTPPAAVKGRDDQPLMIAQMKALGSPLRLELFQRIARDPATATGLAGELGVPVTRLYHHLRQLVAAGMIEVAATERKRGTIERTYRSAISEVEFDPRLVVGPDGGSGPGVAAIRAALRLAEEGVVKMLPHPELEPYGLFEQELLRLSRRDARRFRRRIDRLFEEMREAHTSEGTLEVALTVALTARRAGRSS